MKRLGARLLAAMVFAAAGFGAAQAQTIKIGIAQPLSGANADYFQRQAVDPVLLAVEQINAAGGLLGRRVEVVIEDHKGDPSTSAAVTRKMIDVDHILMLTTSVSPALLAALPIAEENNVIVMSLAQHPKLTESNWGFRITATGANYGVAMANFAFDKLGAKTVAMLGENNDAIRISQIALKKRFEELGGKVVASETFAPADQDLRAQLTKIRASQAQVLSLQSTGPRMHGLALKQAAEMKIPFTGIITNQTVTDPQVFAIAGPAASGVYYAAVDFDHTWNETVFKPRFHVDAESEAAETYDGVNKYFAAVKAAGTTDPVKVRDTLLSMPASQGISGVWGYAGSGEPTLLPSVKKLP